MSAPLISILAADLTRCSLFERCTVVLIGGIVSTIGSLNDSPDKMLRLVECTLRLHYYTPRHPAAGWSGKINCSTEIFITFEK